MVSVEAGSKGELQTNLIGLLGNIFSWAYPADKYSFCIRVRLYR